MTALEEFGKILSQLTGVVTRLADIEEQKAEAAAQKQHSLIDPLLREEQPLILSLRGLEKQRMEQSAVLGWEGLTFRQILDTADAEQKAALTPLFTELQEKTNRLRQTRETSDRMIRVCMRELEYITSRLEQTTGGKEPHSFHDKYV